MPDIADRPDALWVIMFPTCGNEKLFSYVASFGYYYIQNVPQFHLLRL